MTAVARAASRDQRSSIGVEQAAPSVIKLALRDFAPFAAALIPFAMAIGTAASVNGLTLPQAAFGAVFLLAGTAQLASIELIGSDTGATVVVVTVLLINVRFMFYGAGLARWFAGAPLRHKLLLAFPLVDQSYLCCEERFTTMTVLADRYRYYLAGTAILMSVFLTSEVVGYLAGPIVPAWMGLQLAAPLAFTGMLVKAVRSAQTAVVAVVAAVTVVVSTGLPGGLGLPVAILVGVCAGSRMQRARS